MSFRHVVMFKWSDDVPDDHVDRVRDGLDALSSSIGEIRTYVHGPDLGVSDGAWDYALVADFVDIDGFLTYRDHPSHRRFLDEVIRDNTAERAAVQYRT